MPEDKLIDPAWLVRARKNRKSFALRLALVFGILSVLAWWALPRLEGRMREFERISTLRKGAPPAPAPARLLAASAGAFRLFWTAIAVGCAAAALLGFTGKIDTLIPVLNLALLFVAAGALGLTFYVFYAPSLILLEALR